MYQFISFFYCFLACGFCHCFESRTNLPLTLLQSLRINTGRFKAAKNLLTAVSPKPVYNIAEKGLHKI